MVEKVFQLLAEIQIIITMGVVMISFLFGTLQQIQKKFTTWVRFDGSVEPLDFVLCVYYRMDKKGSFLLLKLRWRTVHTHEHKNQSKTIY